jgi:ubiquinone/menaquinone biosynthesis C-methylase UbiE
METKNFIKYKIYNFDFLSLKKIQDSLYASIKSYLKDKKNLKVADIGCGEKPYLQLFGDNYQEYVGMDIRKGKNVDVVVSSEDIPFSDEYFDVVLSTQVLEHTRNYQSSISEAHRILKKGGIGFFSVPGVWEIHGAPHDYWRFTKYGLKEAFKSFDHIEIVNNGGAVLCFFQICNIYLKKLRRIPILGLLIICIIIINNMLGWYLDKLAEKYDFFVINYLVIVKK